MPAKNQQQNKRAFQEVKTLVKSLIKTSRIKEIIEVCLHCF